MANILLFSLLLCLGEMSAVLWKINVMGCLMVVLIAQLILQHRAVGGGDKSQEIDKWSPV